MRTAPRRTVAVVLTSAVSGIPPFGAVVVAAGLTRVPLLLVIPAGVVGRLARYCVLAAVPGMLQSWIWV